MTGATGLSVRSAALTGGGALIIGAVLATALAPPAGASAPGDTRPAATAAPLPRVLYRVPTTDPVFFITVDDGWSKQSAAARWVTERKIPVTVFLTHSEVGGRWSFFRAMAAFDSVQNHSMTHQPLGRESTNRRYEICQTQNVYERRFGVRPWILRPPYGDGWFSRTYAAPAIRKTAASCGIRYIVLWNIVVLRDGRVLYVQDLKLQRGDIVLLHFEGDLRANLQKIVSLYARKGLRPAPLSRYLPAAVG